MSVINTHNFGRFWYVFCTVTHRCGVPKRFPSLLNLGERLHVSDQHSQFWPILVRFLDYYSPFSGPQVISTTNEPRGAFTCRSSTFVVLADSGPLHGLSHIVLGSRSDIHGCRIPRYAYVSVINTRSFVDSGPFRALLLTFLGSQRGFHD